jgi:hypothetical protein
MSSLRVAAATVVAVLAAWSSPDAQRPTSTFHLLVDGPLRVGSGLKRAAGEGYSCAAVAQPLAPLLPRNVAVIMGRRAGAPPGSAAIEVVVPQNTNIEAFDEAVNRVAAKGHVMCGLTITGPVQGLPHAIVPVAVMTGIIVPGASPPSYRIIRTRGRREERERLDRYGADGYAVVHLVARPLSETSDESEVLFVLEKTAASRPLDYRQAFGTNEATLQTSIDTFAKAGRRVHAAWATQGRVDALMTKPLEGDWPGEREYVVDEQSSLRISSFDGALLRMLRPKSAFIGIYDKRITREHTVSSGEVADVASRPISAPRNETMIVEKLDADGGRGYWPIDFTLRPGGASTLQADVILARDR